MTWKDLLSRLLGGGRPNPQELALYSAAVAQARREAFYTGFGVADTVDGRFDMVSLHVYLILRRLRGGGPQCESLSQALADLMFADMDQNLREMGVGDLGVGKRVRRMAEAFYGRLKAYDAALAESPDGLEDALRRNVYRGEPAGDAAALAGYVRRQLALVADQPLERITAGHIVFGEPTEQA